MCFTFQYGREAENSLVILTAEERKLAETSSEESYKKPRILEKRELHDEDYNYIESLL